jgi:hypothetical protein
MPKYVAPNLRGPKQVWVPSKSGWLLVGTMALEAWFNWIHIVHHFIESSIEAYCYLIPMPSHDEWSPNELQRTSAMILFVVIYWILEGLQNIWDEAC